MGQTLEQKINAGIAKHQFWFDDYRTSPDVHLHCWCGATLLIDYFQFGLAEMNRRIASFSAEHKACVPHDTTTMHRHVNTQASLDEGVARARVRRYYRPEVHDE